MPQALGLLADVEGKRFGRRVPAVLPPALALLHSHIAASEGGDCADDVDGENAVHVARGWQQAYTALLLLEKILKQVFAFSRETKKLPKR